MSFKKNINLIVKRTLLLIIILYSNYSWAIGLGDVKVYSYLNEPLSAEIVLTGVDELDTHNIIAELASPNDFMRTGIPRPFFLTKLKFETIRTNGITVIYISTAKVLKNPFLDFLVQLTWPDGKIIKSYTILLDPQTDSHVRRNVPISKKVGLLDDLNKVNKNNNFNDESMDHDKSLSLSQQLKSDITSDAIFATSLEESTDNESILKSKDKHISKAFVVPENTVMLSTTESEEEIEKHNNNHSGNNVSHQDPDNYQDSVLTKVVSSLQAFSEHSTRPKVNYEKLLDLKPTTVNVHKDAEKLAENIAISQINSELDSLRHKNSEKLYYVNSDESHKETIVSNTYLELIKKYGNDLLWTCFLVSTTVFLFHKMISSNQSVDSLIPQPASTKPLHNNNFNFDDNHDHDYHQN